MPTILWPLFLCGGTITCSMLAVHPLWLWIHLSSKLKRNYLRVVFKRYAKLVGQLAGKKLLAWAETKLKSFEVCCRLRTDEYLACQTLSLLLSAVAALMLGGKWAFGLCLLGLILPRLYLKMSLKRWKAAFYLQFPFAIDLLSLAVNSGTGLQSALEEVAENMPSGPLRDELWRAMGHIYLGGSFQEALEDFSQRSGIEEVKSFVTALIQAQQLGTKIEGVLNILVNNMRERRSQEAEERSQLLPLKMLVPMLLFIFPALLILLFAPFIVSGYLLF